MGGGGGYSGTLGFGLSDNFHFGGLFWDTWIWTLTIFILGGYSGTLGFGLSDNFHWGGGILGHSDLDSLTIFIWGGILGHLDLDSLTIFILGGGILGHSDLDSLTIFIWGGILGHSDLDSLTIFIWGGILYQVTTEQGYSVGFGPKFQPLQQPHASQIVPHILRMWRLIVNLNMTNFRTRIWPLSWMTLYSGRN